MSESQKQFATSHEDAIQAVSKLEGAIQSALLADTVAECEKEWENAARFRKVIVEALRSIPSETACKATSYAPNGGASQEQRWNCEECGDVTDTDRCPKGRQNETLAKLASVPSATPRSEPTQADLLECYRFWCHYSSLNEGAQDDENEERNKWLEKMEGWAT